MTDTVVDVLEKRISPEGWPEAVADTEGHQIVVAGPGTGKTEFLVRRVQHLVTASKARRDQIVVLSFSRRASGDLRSRIEDALGATGVPIDTTTFHSLALRLLEAGTKDGHRPTPLTTPEQVRLVAQILAKEEPEDWPVNYRGILETPAFAAEVADFLMRCSERLLTPEDLAEKASQRADWRGLPGLYSKYIATLREIDRTDYGVLLASAVDLLRTATGRDLASAYEYVIVDEFQDTSTAQAEIADLLAVRGNLTVTGDPYQSIYSFRGAELRNIADFSERHPEARRIILDTSLRVPGQILDAALGVVSSGDLPGAAGPVRPAPHEGRVEAYIFDQETAEAEWIASEVEHAIEVEALRPSSIAVLVRSKKELFNELSRALGRRSIPHDPPESRLVDHPAVRLFHDLCIVAMSGGALPATSPTAAAEADRAMRRVLLGPVVRASLGQERALLRERWRTWEAWSLVIERRLPTHTGLAGIIGSASWATGLSAADGFWHVWSNLDGLDTLVADPERAEWRRAWSAFAQVLYRQAQRDPAVTLARFFEMTEEEDFEATPLISHRLPTERVVLTTLHQAKGLEFDLVFIANAVEGVFPDLRRSKRMLRPELLSPERTTDPGAQHLFQLQEEMRLAYTAMTRARLRVVWTATDAGVDQGENRPSRFLLAASGATAVADLGQPSERAGDPVTLREAEVRLRRALLDPGAPRIDRLVAAATLGSGDWWDPASFAGVVEPGPDRPILAETFRLSPSQANSYETCPRRYALERRLRLGDADSPYAQFGSLIHGALETAEREVINTGRPHADPGRAMQILEETWKDAAFGTPELNDAWLRKAREVFTKLYENWPTRDGVAVALETRLEGEIDGVMWIGVVDRVERTGTGLRVIDYKTSRSAVTREEAAVSIQLGFYVSALGGEEDVVAAEFWYPRTNAKTVSRPGLDMSRLDEVREKMTEVTRAVRSEKWDPRVGKHCERCDFRLSCPAWPEGRGAYIP